MSITGTIPQQAFEKIRQRICEILIENLTIQAVIDEEPAPGVWEERIKTFNDTEVPAINVSINDGSYDNENVLRSEGTYSYNIDCYVNSDFGLERGDKLAMLKLSKLIGRVCTILRNPQYAMLGYPRGTVSKRKVERFFIGDKSNVADALSNVVGRVNLTVVGIETNEVGTSVALEESATTISFIDTEEGIYYQYNP